MPTGVVGKVGKKVGKMGKALKAGEKAFNALFQIRYRLLGSQKPRMARLNVHSARP